MTKIDFSPPSHDELWDRWRKDCDAALQQMETDVSQGREPEISNLYKRKSIKEKFYFSDDSAFHGKCAYCECYLKQFQHPDIEHYRPKAGVTNEHDMPVSVDYGKGLELHRGYYWRAYSIQNLLPACEICNQPSTVSTEKVGKHNRFPVVGDYARNESEVAAESPLLINPLTEDPEKEIGVNLEDGSFFAKNGSERAEVTIKVLGLTIRDKLRERRLGKIREVKALLGELLHNPSHRSEVMSELKAMKEGHREHTLVIRAVLRDIAGLFGALA
jgi:hypothetical protein